MTTTHTLRRQQSIDGSDNVDITPPSGIGIDDLVSVLTHPRRRTIVHRVSFAPARAVSPADLAKTLAVLEHGGACSAEQYDRARIALEHVHLPMLTGANVIKCDSETDTIRQGPNFDAAQSALRALETIEG